jgi:hypothetical protein
MTKRGPTLIDAIVIVVILLVIAFLATPTISCGGRPSNERNAMTSLRTLSSAQADFRVNDRDWNHVNDFWTGDVKGLYTMTSAAVQGAEANSTTDPSIKLIELSVAAADADGVLVPAGGENRTLASFAAPSSKAGHWFAAMTADPSGPGTDYRQDTGGEPQMGRCHNLYRFGIVSFPDAPTAGKYVWIVNESNVIYSIEDRRRATSAASVPPGLGILPPEYLRWPSVEALKASWRKVE